MVSRYANLYGKSVEETDSEILKEFHITSTVRQGCITINLRTREPNLHHMTEVTIDDKYSLIVAYLGDEEIEKLVNSGYKELEL